MYEDPKLIKNTKKERKTKTAMMTKAPYLLEWMDLTFFFFKDS